MMQLLPTKILDWVNPKDFNIDIYSTNGSIGCFLEDDLDRTNELHDLHNYYPLAVERRSNRRNAVGISITNDRIYQLFFLQK